MTDMISLRASKLVWVIQLIEYCANCISFSVEILYLPAAERFHRNMVITSEVKHNCINEY